MAAARSAKNKAGILNTRALYGGGRCAVVAIENVLLAAESVVALVLTVIAVLALRRAKDMHLAYLAAAFGIFFLKALVLTISLFALSLPPGQIFLLSGSLDLVILALFYGFTLRR